MLKSPNLFRAISGLWVFWAVCISSAWAIDPIVIEQRLASLKPEFPTSADLGYQVACLGFSIVSENAESSDSTGPVLQCGATYRVRFLWKALEPDVRNEDLLFWIGNLAVKRAHWEKNSAQIGEVWTQELDFRIPLNATPGKNYLNVNQVDGAHLTSPGVKIGEIVISGPSSSTPDYAGVAPLSSKEDNLIRNGSFERGLADWTWMPLPGYGVSVDETISYDGRTSVRIDFAGGLDYSYVWPGQSVAVIPGGHYLLSYYIRAEDITSSSGPEIEIFNPEWSISTGGTIGSHEWIQRNLEFSIPDGVSGIEIRIRRHGGDGQAINGNPYAVSSYGPIGGTCWIDRVSLNLLSASMSN